MLIYDADDKGYIFKYNLSENFGFEHDFRINEFEHIPNSSPAKDTRARFTHYPTEAFADSYHSPDASSLEED